MLEEASTTFLPPKALAQLPSDLLFEVVDGEIQELPLMGVYEVWLASELARSLGNFARDHGLGRAVSEMLFDLRPHVERNRRPDVAFVSFGRWARERRVPGARARGRLSRTWRSRLSARTTLRPTSTPRSRSTSSQAPGSSGSCTPTLAMSSSLSRRPGSASSSAARTWSAAMSCPASDCLSPSSSMRPKPWDKAGPRRARIADTLPIRPTFRLKSCRTPGNPDASLGMVPEPGHRRRTTRASRERFHRDALRCVDAGFSPACDRSLRLSESRSRHVRHL